MRQMAQAQSATLEQSCIQILSSPPTLGTLLTLSKSVSSTTTCESQQCLIIEPQFSCSVVSNSLQPHGLQHIMPPCPSPTPGVYSNSCPLSWWCHLTTSSSVIPFFHLQSFRLQSFPALGSFQMSQFFASGGQNIGVLFSASVLQYWFPLRWTGWISLQSRD